MGGRYVLRLRDDKLGIFMSCDSDMINWGSLCILARGQLFGSFMWRWDRC